MAASDIPQSVKDQTDLTSDHINIWLKNDFLSLGWWVLIALIIVSLTVWLLLLDKRRLRETLLFAALMAIIGLGINEYGEELILWDYPVDVIPIFPPLSSLNLLLLPPAYSLAYQYSKTARRFLWTSLAITAALCFAVEPLLSLGNLYQLLNWQYWWGFPLYFTSALLARKVTVKIFKIEKRTEEAG